MTTIPSKETENFLSLLDGVRRAGSGWVSKCPCRNDDNNPSLSIGQGADGRVLVTCHRGMSCNVEEICSAVGLEVSDLMPKKDGYDLSPTSTPVRPPQRQSSQESFSKKTEQPVKLKLVATYDYTDEAGKVLFQKLRYVDENGRKSFRQRKPDGNGGWEYSLGDIPKVLYNLPAVIAARSYNTPVWVVEGEKDADTLIELGYVATTMPGGAGKWLDIHTEPLSGLVVEIIADKDEIGIRHALDVRNKLTAAGADAQVWLCPSDKDITDHIQSGRSIDDLVAHEEHVQNAGDDNDSGFNEVIAEEQEIDEEISPEGLALLKLREMLDRDDLNIKQKLAKSNLILSSATVSYSLDTGRLVHWNDFLKETDGDAYEWVIPGLIERSERVIVVAAEGVGKRATIDSMIPTPSGWTTLENIVVGDKVIDRFGNPVNVTYVSPIEPNPDSYRLTFSDGNYIDADAEHQWYTETLNEREQRQVGGVRTTKEILETLVSSRKSRALNHAIPTTKPLNLPEAKLPIPPYTLGAWLGDGNTVDGSICSEDDEILDAIRSDGYVVRKRESTPNIYGILGLKAQLKKHGLYGNKHIPAIYSRASYKQRLEIVQGLMDTDGYVRKDGLCEFSVNHKELAKGFLDIIQTLGIKATMHESDSKLYGKVTGTRYRISFKTDILVCRLKRKVERLPKKLATSRSLYRYIVSVEPITPVPMRCISVDGPDNTYLIGDAYIPTHNTMLARQVALLSAAGIHPLSFQPMEPIKTLTVDLENPDRIIRRTGRSIAAQAMAMGRVSRLNAELLTRPSGMDLLRASDRALLEETLDKVKPELLVIGPLYKAFLDPGGRTSESIALEVAKYLDTIRTIYKCALWIEHHAPLGTSMTSRDLRPFGSAVWSRWPEFGISLQPDPTALGAYVYDVRHFRGARDERQWPTKIKRGVRFPFEVIEWSKAVK